MAAKTARKSSGQYGAPPARRNSKETASLILKSARHVLMNEGYAQFSMRNVAEHAGVYLANVQYYFQTRDDLVRALMEHTAAGYLTSFDEIRARTRDDRIGRFTAFIDFNLKDTGNPETRRFFIQLWALLSTMDDSGALLKELYEKNIGQFSDAIQDLVGDVDPAEVRRRATTLSAMMEGLHVVQSAHSGSASEMKRLMTLARDTALHIALGLRGLASL